MFTLVRTSAFDRQLARFIRRHPDLRQRVAQVLRDLEQDPFQPHLRLHALAGELDGCHAVRVTYSYRVVLTLALQEQEITLLDIGSHDAAYR